MPESMLSDAQIVITVALMAWMITGFTPLPGRWLRWKMFCRATFTIVQLTGTKDGHAEPVNVYDHLSPGSFILGPPKLLDEHVVGHGQQFGELPLDLAQDSNAQPPARQGPQ